MKKIYLLALLLIPFLLTSCLNSEADESAYSQECDITSVAFEHRWAVHSDVEGIWTLHFKELEVASKIDNAAQMVTLDLTVPTIDNSFPEDERRKVDLSSLVCSFFVSKAARVDPLDGAPKLGTLADFSAKTFRYRVTSASGVYKDWTITINSFTK